MQFNLINLPLDLVIKTFSLLEAKDISRGQRVCKKLNSILEPLWENFFKKDFCSYIISKTSWKEIYLSTYRDWESAKIAKEKQELIFSKGLDGTISRISLTELASSDELLLNMTKSHKSNTNLFYNCISTLLAKKVSFATQDNKKIHAFGYALRSSNPPLIDLFLKAMGNDLSIFKTEKGFGKKKFPTLPLQFFSKKFNPNHSILFRKILTKIKADRGAIKVQNLKHVASNLISCNPTYGSSHPYRSEDLLFLVRTLSEEKNLDLLLDSDLFSAFSSFKGKDPERDALDIVDIFESNFSDRPHVFANLLLSHYSQYRQKTPIHLAIENDNLRILQKYLMILLFHGLLKKGLESTDEDGLTPLCYLDVNENSLFRIKKLIQNFEINESFPRVWDHVLDLAKTDHNILQILHPNLDFFVSLKLERYQEVIDYFKKDDELASLFEGAVDKTGGNIFHAFQNCGGLVKNEMWDLLLIKAKQFPDLSRKLVLGTTSDNYGRNTPLHTFILQQQSPERIFAYLILLDHLKTLDECLQMKNINSKTPFQLIYENLQPYMHFFFQSLIHKNLIMSESFKELDVDIIHRISQVLKKYWHTK